MRKSIRKKDSQHHFFLGCLVPERRWVGIMVFHSQSKAFEIKSPGLFTLSTYTASKKVIGNIPPTIRSRNCSKNLEPSTFFFAVPGRKKLSPR